jgi:hypothetical protein
MKTKEYQPDERPALAMTTHGRKVVKRITQGYVITDAARREMNKPLPMDVYPVIKMEGSK